jgi:hypothetical protein
MKFYITGTRRGLGFELLKKLNTVNSLEDCDIFINNKHDGYTQVERLFEAAKLGKRVISIGSRASDYNGVGRENIFEYAIEKKALRAANEQLYNMGHNVTCLNFGYFDTERVSHKDVPKMNLDYVIKIILWVIEQPYRIKEITISV